MLSQTLLREGKVEDALTELIKTTREDPANSELRIYLFQLLAIDEQYDRALTQLTIIYEMDTETLMMVQTYRQVIQTEVFRQTVFNGEHAPLIFGKPEDWVAPILASLKQSAAGNHLQAQQLRDQGFSKIPDLSGTIDGEKFEWLVDADSRIGPFFEAIVNGKYFWIPMTAIQQVTLSKPEDLRDLIWLPAEFTWVNGGTAIGFIPVRYINKHNKDNNPLFKLSRLTDWQRLDNDIFYGSGQRILATDKNDYGLLDIRQIEFNQTHAQQ